MRFSWLIVLVLVLTGCSLKEVQTRPVEYKLEVSTNQYIEPKNDKRVLRVQRCEGDRVANSRFLFYKQNSAIKPYKYARWSEIPSVRLQQILTEALENQHIFSSVVSSSSFVVANLFLESIIENFEELYVKEKSFVHVKIRFRLVSRKNAKLIDSKLIEHKIEVKEKNTKAVIKAYQKALGLVIKDLSEWLYNAK
ncbi:ABC-type transport auxiliary lipoprotein family protein [Sulfurospirillum sp. 1307]|jgi:cholesterol transport system auxiliary component